MFAYKRITRSKPAVVGMYLEQTPHMEVLVWPKLFTSIGIAMSKILQEINRASS